MIEQSIEGLKTALKTSVFNTQKLKEATKIALNTLLQYSMNLRCIRTKEMAVAGTVFAVEKYVGKNKTRLSKLALTLTQISRNRIKSNLDHIIETITKSYNTQTTKEEVNKLVFESCDEWLKEIYLENGIPL